jgi:hypothetical protein
MDELNLHQGASTYLPMDHSAMTSRERPDRASNRFIGGLQGHLQESTEAGKLQGEISLWQERHKNATKKVEQKIQECKASIKIDDTFFDVLLSYYLSMQYVICRDEETKYNQNLMDNFISKYNKHVSDAIISLGYNDNAIEDCIKKWKSIDNEVHKIYEIKERIISYNRSIKYNQEQIDAQPCRNDDEKKDLWYLEENFPHVHTYTNLLNETQRNSLRGGRVQDTANQS